MVHISFPYYLVSDMSNQAKEVGMLCRSTQGPHTCGWIVPLMALSSLMYSTYLWVNHGTPSPSYAIKPFAGMKSQGHAPVKPRLVCSEGGVLKQKHFLTFSHHKERLFPEKSSVRIPKGN